MNKTKDTGKARRDYASEIDFAETVYIRDIENRVFQSLVLKAVGSIEGVAFVEGGLIDQLLKLGNLDGIKGITVEQDNEKRSVSVRVELNIAYGLSIPDKAQEVQSQITEEITRYTGLHVSSVHVIFKNILSDQEMERLRIDPALLQLHSPTKESIEDEYTDEFAR